MSGTRREFLLSAAGFAAVLAAGDEAAHAAPAARKNWRMPEKNAFRTVENEWIPMPDGVRLGARLWIPLSADKTPVPVVLEYIPYRKRDLERPRDDIWANQLDNVANREGHYETTGHEIFDDLDGRVHGFVSSVGSGGTIAGVGMALKERDPNIKIALADPLGAALYSFYTTGELKSSGSSITEGIGQGRVTAHQTVRSVLWRCRGAGRAPAIPRSSNGGATIISNMCCTMCSEKR